MVGIWRSFCQEMHRSLFQASWEIRVYLFSKISLVTMWSRRPLSQHRALTKPLGRCSGWSGQIWKSLKTHPRLTVGNKGVDEVKGLSYTTSCLWMAEVSTQISLIDRR
jgi:hypothetical protein